MFILLLSWHRSLLLFDIFKTKYFVEIVNYHYEADETIKANKAGPLFNETIPFYLERLDAQAKKNNGYLAVGRVSILPFLM